MFGVEPQEDERQLRCPENSTLDTSFILEWPSTLAGNSAESFPLCFNSAYSPITRICWDNGTWEDSEVLEKCSYYQSKRVSVCEDGFENFASLNEPINCVFISKFKERWSDKCSQLGVTESVSQMQSRLRSLRSFLLQKSISSIWYPVMEIKNMSNNQIIGSKCLKLDLKEDDKQLVDANCDEMHHVLCLDYNIDDFLNHTIVPQSIKFEFKSKYYTMNRFLNEQSNLSSSDGVYK